MSETATATTYVNEVDEITKVMQAYIDGARTGKGAAMKPAFDDGATICGYVGSDLFAGPIQGLYDWNDGNGPATEIECRFTSIDVVGRQPAFGWMSTTGRVIALPISSIS